MKKNILIGILASTFVMSGAWAEGHIMSDGAMDSDKDKVVFYATTNKLILPKIHYVDADGNMTSTLYAAELEISKAVEGEPLEFKVTEGPNETDEHGCVLPETWHAEMNHCMVQN